MIENGSSWESRVLALHLRSASEELGHLNLSESPVPALENNEEEGVTG